MNHPEAGEWMSYVYGELPPAKRRELETHLGQCPACTAQLKSWREGMNALDTWTLPARRPARRGFIPAFKWAAAAALVLALGIVLGRETSRNTAEIASLRNSVAELTARVQRQSESGLTNGITAAKSETLRVLADYARLQDARRAEDQKAFNVTLRNFDDRIDRLRTELETVALNTQNGFEETHQVIASFTAPTAQGNN